MPKRVGYLIEKIADMDNLRAADKAAQAGKVKKNRHIRRHNLHAEEDLLELQRMILTLKFPEPEYTPLIVENDNGKRRRIDKQKYHPWRILHLAILNVIGPDIYKSLIADSFACVKGKGLHYGVKRLKMMLRRYPEYRWFWKTDIKKYYQSIPHDTILDELNRKFKDKQFIRLMEVAILTYDSGQEIIDLLDAEKRQKARNPHRRVSESAARKLHNAQDRSSDEGKTEGQDLPAVL